MSIDIAKQLDLRPYNDKNVVSKPVVQEQAKTQPPVDEDKSNAAKWMIGLTATAAIAIGGLYAAKHGKLGESAEKFAKKIFGETVNEVKPNPPTTSAPDNISNPVPAVVTLTPLFFARKGISKLIKKPNKSLAEIMTEFQQAGVKLEKKSENLLEIRTGKGPSDITQLHFSPEGILSSIQRTTKKATQEIFTFENNVLSKIEREIPTPSGRPLEHIVEFTQDGAVKAKKILLNDGLRELPINSSTAKIFKNEEIVEAYIPRSSKYFKQAVRELEIARKPAEKFGDDSSINVSSILRPFYDAHNSAKEAKLFDQRMYTPKEVTQYIKNLLGSKDEFKAEVFRLIHKDIEGMKTISDNTLIAMANDYITKLKTYKITKPEHVAIVGKPIKDCSYAEFKQILKEVAPDKAGKLGVVADPFKDHAQEENAILWTIERLTGRSNINNKTTLLEILQDL